MPPRRFRAQDDSSPAPLGDDEPWASEARSAPSLDDAPPSSGELPAGGNEAPAGGDVPSLDDGDAPSPDDLEPLDAAEAPPPGAPDEPRIDRATLERYLAQKTTRARLCDVVYGRLGDEANRADVDDIVQNAWVAMKQSKWLPQSEARIPGWTYRITMRAIARFCRPNGTRQKWIDHEAQNEEHRGDQEPWDPEAMLDAPKWMIGPWIEQQVANDPKDKLTLEMLRFKAREEKTDAEVAREYGLSEKAWVSRSVRFKKKYLPKREAYRDRKLREVLWALLFAAVAAALVVLSWLAWGRRPRVEPIGPEPSVSALPSAPEPVAPPPPAPFNQAVSAEPPRAPEKPPVPEKPEMGPRRGKP